MKQAAADRILMLVKMHGEVTSTLVAEALQITKEGARLHLLKLMNDALILAMQRKEGVGRPHTYYRLTEKGLLRFPDTHAQVTVQLLRSVKNLLGDNALDLLIGEREKEAFLRYDQLLQGTHDLETKLTLLTKARSDEGYMADWVKENDHYLLIENHCPICAAATECQGFCRAELRNFKQLIGAGYAVERIKHVLTGGERCVYRIAPLADVNAQSNNR
ncbi:helix-turn-helix transcriptional regulator [Sphingobacterium suaedae]|uniref:Helix-turn-helix transcriptional regulator n=1 Tax=Sphingobacterium suaedae TaxID=1686402 RepID=A0ABW5KIP7_9SPHI